MASASETAVQSYFCPVRKVCLGRQLGLGWFYFDPLGTFASLARLLRLISVRRQSVLVDRTTIITARQLLSARHLRLSTFLRSLGLLRLAPALCSATF